MEKGERKEEGRDVAVVEVLFDEGDGCVVFFVGRGVVAESKGEGSWRFVLGSVCVWLLVFNWVEWANGGGGF